MPYQDQELENFVTNGAQLPPNGKEGSIVNKGAKIWFTTYGSGKPVIMLHDGLGHSGNWSYQVPALVKAGYYVILIDSRGHGHSTRDSQRYTYELMASDVIKVMDNLKLSKAAAVGWSDGACIAMILGMQIPERITGVFFYGCNMDPSGTKEITEEPITLQRCFKRHSLDYKALSSTPDKFNEFVQAVSKMMETEPNYTAKELQEIKVPVAIVQSEFDEFIKLEHAEYLVNTIPGAKFIFLKGVSHFAPLQQPDYYNQYLLSFLKDISVNN